MTVPAQPRPETLELLRSLIAFDTTSRESNLGLIEWVRDHLRRMGVQQIRLSHDADKRKANLFATVGEGAEPGLILSGHTDVVPVDGQAWGSDPFRAELRDGRLYGRGSCDMKGFIACALAAVPQMLAHTGRAPFHLALSFDEEVGCLGVRHLLADLAEQNLRAAACIVGEPTEMQLVVANKGRRELRCCVRGKEAHSSLPALGVNAVEHGAQIIAFVQRLARREAAQGPRWPGYDVPYTTLQCGTVRGGIAPNTVPKDCEFSIEMRYPPGERPQRLVDEIEAFIAQEVLPQMRQSWPQTSVSLELVNDTPGFEIDEKAALVRTLQRLAGARRMERVAYSTEAGLFQQHGLPTVICGPGSIEQAHRPDEYIALSELAACEEFLDRLVAHLAG